MFVNDEEQKVSKKLGEGANNRFLSIDYTNPENLRNYRSSSMRERSFEDDS
jgi:hypothetical protein